MKEKVMSMLALLLATTGTVVTTYKVTLKEGTEDATNWQVKVGEGEYQALPLEGVAAGTAVSFKYNGTKKVKSVKLRKKVVAAEGHALSASVVGELVGSDGKAYAVADKDNLPQGVTAVAMVAYRSETVGSSLAIQLNADPKGGSWSEAKTYAEGLAAVPGGKWRLPSKADWQNMFVGCAVSGDDKDASDDYMDPIAGFKAKIAATGTGWHSVYYWSSTPGDSLAWAVSVILYSSAAHATFRDESGLCMALGCLAF